MNPSTLRALAYIVQTISESDGEVSLNQLLAHRRHIRRTDIAKAWDRFLGLKLLEATEDEQGYRLVGFKEEKVVDFLTIWMRKSARVSAVGHRSVRVAAQVMALHERVTSRACGSIIWKEKVPMPKYRLPPVRVLDLIGGKRILQHFTVDDSKPTHMQFRLNFEPALAAGKIVEYGFYVWNRN